MSARSVGPMIFATAIEVLSYAVLVGTPPKNENAYDVSGLEGLGARSWRGRDEEGVGVGKRHHRECGIHSHACDLDRRLTEVELGLAGGLAQAVRRPRRSFFDTQRRSGGP